MLITMIIDWFKSLFATSKHPRANNPPQPLSHAERGDIARSNHINNFAEAGFPFFSLMASNDERDCNWCKANDGKKFPIDTDINQLIRDNCTCEYCRCTVRAQRR